MAEPWYDWEAEESYMTALWVSFVQVSQNPVLVSNVHGHQDICLWALGARRGVKLPKIFAVILDENGVDGRKSGPQSTRGVRTSWMALSSNQRPSHQQSEQLSLRYGSGQCGLFSSSPLSLVTVTGNFRFNPPWLEAAENSSSSVNSLLDKLS